MHSTVVFFFLQWLHSKGAQSVIQRGPQGTTECIRPRSFGPKYRASPDRERSSRSHNVHSVGRCAQCTRSKEITFDKSFCRCGVPIYRVRSWALDFSSVPNTLTSLVFTGMADLHFTISQKNREEWRQFFFGIFQIMMHILTNGLFLFYKMLFNMNQRLKT